MIDDGHEGSLWRAAAWGVALSVPVWGLLVWIAVVMLDAISEALSAVERTV